MQGVGFLPSTFVIRGGRVVDPANGVDRVDDLVIADGRIAAVGAGHTTPSAAIDARGLIVCPGLIDMHVHLREPGGEHKETIETGTRAAAAGGFTAVACMPNTSPPIDNIETLAFVQQRAQERGYCRVYPVAAMTRGRCGVEPLDLGDLQTRGAIAFSDDGAAIEREDVMREVCRRAHASGALLIQHCQAKELSAGGVIHEGAVSRDLNLPGLSPEAVMVMIERDLNVVRETGARYHVAHISTAGALDLVRSAKRDGLPVTCEVCVHHLVLTDEACREQDPNTKMNPPLRGERDVTACVEALTDGTIDCIVTDHAPHAAEEKAKGMLAAPFGIVGLETALGIVAERLVHGGVMGWSDVVELLSVVPGRILGVEGGTLIGGAPADVLLIDPVTPWRIDPERFHSKSRNSPFAGWEVRARAVATIADGRLTHRLDAYRSRFDGLRATHP
jgi:dihydroorotase